jgi:hypothetical protein
MKSFILRWRMVLVLVATLVSVTAYLGAGPAAAETIRTPLDNYNLNCTILSQTMWVEDGILYIRDRVMEGVVVSNSDTHDGLGHMTANANIDLATFYGSYWGTLEIYPTDYPDGHWAGSFAMQVNEGRAAGIARLQGYGDFNGLSTKADLTPLTNLGDFAYLCGGNQPISGAHAVGFFMNPGGR